ncbi:hypothetical protein A2Y83_05005 [Candidatus Falkowbacteria bacterium RBG_13_39_14]|uniref:Uncharacterized protein n=1 Tax=Candidatus Falkowbacteria bacterium RBG_13_39_14 TaxID=1797985 RepID=A0A1F5S4C5_9BACT|nr:MAG: hypothetical protein A2Y83_05005 [Candidatus Falkowbacteria bacterium RBG_13_39_14]
MNERNFLKAMNRETEARTPVREKKELAKNPLEIWQSKEVTELLLDFFTILGTNGIPFFRKIIFH